MKISKIHFKIWVIRIGRIGGPGSEHLEKGTPARSGPEGPGPVETECVRGR